MFISGLFGIWKHQDIFIAYVITIYSESSYLEWGANDQISFFLLESLLSDS